MGKEKDGAIIGQMLCCRSEDTKWKQEKFTSCMKDYGV